MNEAGEENLQANDGWMIAKGKWMEEKKMKEKKKNNHARLNIICKVETKKKGRKLKGLQKMNGRNQEDRITRKISHDVEDGLLTKKLETRLLREKLYGREGR